MQLDLNTNWIVHFPRYGYLKKIQKFKKIYN